MKISIVTVVYNSVDKINETIFSILSQTYNNIEYIIVDGGSTDGTVEIIKQYADRVAYWCSEKDNGIYDAMNKALHQASGDFAIFVNSGDSLYSPDTISNMVDQITDSNAVYYGNAIYIKGSKNDMEWRGGPFTKCRLSKTNICHQTIFYPRIIYSKFSYDLKYPFFADWVYNMQTYSLVPFIYINQNISYYDGTGVSASCVDRKFREDKLFLISKYLGVQCLAYLIFSKLRKCLVQKM